MAREQFDCQREGVLFCLVGPTGAGKTELARYLIEHHANARRSISATTRAPREGEVDGESYFFISEEEFKAKIKNNEFIEYEKVHGSLYGTLKSTVDEALSDKRDLILDIDVKGAFNFKARMGQHTVVVFVLPPSFKILQERIRTRGKMSQDEFEKRMETARREFQTLLDSLAGGRLRGTGKVDYLLVNDDLKSACEAVSALLSAEQMRIKRISRESICTLLDFKT